MKKYIFASLSFLLLVFFDQYTKYLAKLFLKGQKSMDLIPNVFRLEYLENQGAAFGIFQNQTIFLVILSFIILLGISIGFIGISQYKKMMPLQISMILIASGAVGNMIDRIFQKYVIDFLYFVAIDFPVFNVADIYVVIGAFLAGFLIMFYYKEDDFRKETE